MCLCIHACISMSMCLGVHACVCMHVCVSHWHLLQTMVLCPSSSLAGTQVLPLPTAGRLCSKYWCSHYFRCTQTFWDFVSWRFSVRLLLEPHVPWAAHSAHTHIHLESSALRIPHCWSLSLLFLRWQCPTEPGAWNRPLPAGLYSPLKPYSPRPEHAACSYLINGCSSVTENSKNK